MQISCGVQELAVHWLSSSFASHMAQLETDRKMRKYTQLVFLEMVASVTMLKCCYYLLTDCFAIEIYVCRVELKAVSGVF